MSTDRPNIIFILTDDQGWEDLGCFGSCACFGRYPVKTPVLDKMAAEGIRLTSFYAASPVCSPSRVGFMTGQYPGRIRITDWIRARFQGGKIPADGKNPGGFVKGRGGKLMVAQLERPCCLS